MGKSKALPHPSLSLASRHSAQSDRLIVPPQPLAHERAKNDRDTFLGDISIFFRFLGFSHRCPARSLGHSDFLMGVYRNITVSLSHCNNLFRSVSLRSYLKIGPLLLTFLSISQRERILRLRDRNAKVFR